jgi:short-subunit dehydrogenase
VSDPIALVTGGCSGIGLAIARQLAARGHGLLLISERAGPLESAAASIRGAHGVPVEVACVDLSRPGAAEEVHRRARSLGLDVELLVNNAGIFFFGEAVDASPERANALLQLHVVTPSLLCTLFGREMRERRRGQILIVSSISAWRDFPGIAYYGSSKKYLRGFARAIRRAPWPRGSTGSSRRRSGGGSGSASSWIRTGSPRPASGRSSGVTRSACRASPAD